MRLVKYRFKTKSVDDFRPLLDMKEVQMPWWCSGQAADGSYVIIICYLSEDEELEKYWDDAYDIDYWSCDQIEYTDRFPKPEWIE